VPPVWNRVTDIAATRRTGQLGAGQRDQLTRLSTGARFAAEAARPTQPAPCLDTLAYTVSAGTAVVSYVECPDGAPPEAAAAVVRLIVDVVLR
jgi:hypothetical protein